MNKEERNDANWHIVHVRQWLASYAKGRGETFEASLMVMPGPDMMVTADNLAYVLGPKKVHCLYVDLKDHEYPGTEMTWLYDRGCHVTHLMGLKELPATLVSALGQVEGSTDSVRDRLRYMLFHQWSAYNMYTACDARNLDLRLMVSPPSGTIPGEFSVVGWLHASQVRHMAESLNLPTSEDNLIADYKQDAYQFGEPFTAQQVEDWYYEAVPDMERLMDEFDEDENTWVKLTAPTAGESFPQECLRRRFNLNVRVLNQTDVPAYNHS